MLSKSKIVAYRQCPKRLWLSAHKPELAAASKASEAVFAAGHSVEEIARKLYGPGELIFDDARPDFSDALARSRELARSVGVLFEAAFRADETLVLADIVRIAPHGADVIEVKSSTSVKAYHIEDAAIQAYVMRLSGLPVNSVRIAHVDTNFVYAGNGQYEGLLKESDITDEVARLTAEVSGWIGAAKAALSGPEPDVQPGRQCTKPFECPFFSHCNVPDAADYPIENLPGLRSRRIRILQKAGIREVRDIPPSMIDSPNLQRAYRAVVTGAAQIDGEETRALRDLPYPRFYLDFETISFAVPIWVGTSPYQPLPFQWSVHIETAPGQVEHFGFLDLSGESPARTSMVALIELLSETGPVLVYTNYEKGILTKMGALYPDIADGLSAIIARLVDLHPIAKAGYYHRDMQGSWSIKSVLPTIEGAPRYAALSEIHNGLQAQAAYLEAIHYQTNPQRREELHRRLMEYCRLDTLAMVVLVERLVN